MNDPHVEELAYDFVPGDERHDYSNAAPLNATLGPFTVHLEGGMLVATPLVHFGSEGEARETLRPHLASWELRAELESNRPIRFRFANSRIIDRQPTPGAKVVAVGLASEINLAGSVTARALYRDFPTPANDAFADTGIVEELRAFIDHHRRGRVRLLVAAYLVLSLVEYEFGDRAAAVKALSVDPKVLSTLGRLSVVNDPRERRKVRGPERPLTGEEHTWLPKAMSLITLQVAAVEAGRTPPILSMSDLPPLPNPNRVTV